MWSVFTQPFYWDIDSLYLTFLLRYGQSVPDFLTEIMVSQYPVFLLRYGQLVPDLFAEI